MKVRLGHSTDADDAFLSHALLAGEVSPGQFEFEHVTEDLQTLNDRAARGELEVTPISVHAYAYVRDKYLLGHCGAVFADRHGPMIVSREDLGDTSLENAVCAVPGTTSSAYLTVQLCKPRLRTMVLPRDKIIPAVKTGVVACALLVEDDSHCCAKMGLHCLTDLGQWWAARNAGDPLPLRCLAFRKDLPPEVRSKLEAILAESARHALSHHAETTAAALRRKVCQDRCGNEADYELNAGPASLDMGDRGKRIIEKFLAAGHQAGVIPNALPLEFAATEPPV